MHKQIVGLLVLVGGITLFAPFGSGQGADKKKSNIEINDVLITLIDEVEVSVAEAGLVSHVTVTEGQVVSAGQLMARTNDMEQQLRKEKAQIELRNSERLAKNKIKIDLAKKASEVADTELKRGQKSAKRYKKSVSATEIDRLRLAAEKASLDLDQALYDHQTAKLAVDLNRAQVKIASHQAKRRTVVAPIGGTIVKVQRKKGEWVKPGDPFIRIVSTKRLRAETFVTASQLNQIKIGQAVTLVVAKGAVLKGKIVFISPEISPVNGQGRVWAEIANPDEKLRPGQRATLRIKLN